MVFGLVWGVALAVVPAVFAFDDPFTLSPFLVSAFVCSALAGVVGALVAAAWASRRMVRGGGSGMLASVFAGVVHGLGFSVAASVSIWICLAVNISGFSTATPGNIFNLFGNPGIFEMRGIAARAIFVYTLAVGMVLSPVSGALVLRAVRMEGRIIGHKMNTGKGNI
ncbi:MAG: hypothetical protein H0U65_02095 [Rubrobacter sp.]|nr:hypothetical protein [Rubrobacter sp.]